MKFYKYKYGFGYFNKIIVNKLNAIYNHHKNASYTQFFKNGEEHSHKNASYIYNDGHKEYWLNNKRYGTINDFTKESWRRFVKLQAFL